MSEVSPEVINEIIGKVKAEFGIDKDPISNEFVAEMDMLSIVFNEGEGSEQEEGNVGDLIVVVSKDNGVIVAVDVMGVSSFKA